MPVSILIGVICVFLAVILIRAARFNPKPEEEHDREEVSFDRHSLYN